MNMLWPILRDSCSPNLFRSSSTFLFTPNVHPRWSSCCYLAPCVRTGRKFGASSSWHQTPLRYFHGGYGPCYLRKSNVRHPQNYFIHFILWCFIHTLFIHLHLVVMCTLVRLVIHGFIHDVRLILFTLWLFLDSGFILRSSVLNRVKNSNFVVGTVSDYGIMFFFFGKCRMSIIPAVAAASVSHSAAVGGSVVGVVGLL